MGVDSSAAGASSSLGAGLGGAAAAQAAQDADQIPHKLIPKKYQATFNAAYTDALQPLKKPDCLKLYGGQGANIMASTQYEIAPIGGPNVGADTVVPDAGGIVRLNSNGPMYDYGPNSRYFNYWKGGFRGGSAVGSVFLLHELGHQLGDVTHFFNPDAGAKNAARNAANTDRVLKNCF